MENSRPTSSESLLYREWEKRRLQQTQWSARERIGRLPIYAWLEFDDRVKRVVRSAVGQPNHKVLRGKADVTDDGGFYRCGFAFFERSKDILMDYGIPRFSWR